MGLFICCGTAALIERRLLRFEISKSHTHIYTVWLFLKISPLQSSLPTKPATNTRNENSCLPKDSLPYPRNRAAADLCFILHGHRIGIKINNKNQENSIARSIKINLWAKVRYFLISTAELGTHLSIIFYTFILDSLNSHIRSVYHSSDYKKHFTLLSLWGS